MRTPGTWILVLALALCSCKGLIVDPSIPAAEARDQTLILSAGCAAVPAQGLDICRVVEGANISEELQLVVPVDRVVSGEVRARYKGIVKTYAFSSDGVVRIPWKELVGDDVYQLEDEGPAQFTGSARVTTPTGDRFVDVLGFAFLVVLKKGYSPLPLDSGNHAWSMTCKVQYSTAGRSALSCR